MTEIPALVLLLILKGPVCEICLASSSKKASCKHLYFYYYYYYYVQPMANDVMLASNDKLQSDCWLNHPPCGEQVTSESLYKHYFLSSKFRLGKATPTLTPVFLTSHQISHLS